jgi:hypothetical protein
MLIRAVGTVEDVEDYHVGKSFSAPFKSWDPSYFALDPNGNIGNVQTAVQV